MKLDKEKTKTKQNNRPPQKDEELQKASFIFSFFDVLSSRKATEFD